MLTGGNIPKYPKRSSIVHHKKIVHLKIYYYLLIYYIYIYIYFLFIYFIIIFFFPLKISRFLQII
jgi:hypothetical protein